MSLTGYYHRGLRKEKVLLCSCGLSSIKLRNIDSDAKGECPVCGSFGYYRRLWNARFQNESTGYDSKAAPRRRWRPSPKLRRRC